MSHESCQPFWSKTLELLSHSVFRSLASTSLTWSYCFLKKKKKKHLAPLLTSGITVCAWGTLQSLNTFAALPKRPVSVTCTRHCTFQQHVQEAETAADCFPALYSKCHLLGSRSFIFIGNLWLMLMMRSLAIVLITIHQCPQGRMGRKGFPGKVGPEGVKVNNVNTHSWCFSFSKKYKKNIDLIVYLSLQGETGVPGIVGTMGERVRNADMASSIFPNVYPFIHPTLTVCVSGFGGFHRTCGRGRTGRREGKITCYFLVNVFI